MARKTRLTPAELIRMGKGRFASLKPVDCKAAWSGARTPKDEDRFDAVQSEKNLAAGYWSRNDR